MRDGAHSSLEGPGIRGTVAPWGATGALRILARGFVRLRGHRTNSWVLRTLARGLTRARVKGPLHLGAGGKGGPRSGAERGGSTFRRDHARLRPLFKDYTPGAPTIRSETGVEQKWPSGWSAAQLAAAKFLAHFATRMRARDWPDVKGRVPWVWRPPINCRCCYGQNLADGGDFQAQARRAQQLADWDSAQAHLLKRLESGRAPLVLDLFCCAGGVSEGF